MRTDAQIPKGQGRLEMWRRWLVNCKSKIGPNIIFHGRNSQLQSKDGVR